jgi:hypothetical protein
MHESVIKLFRAIPVGLFIFFLRSNNSVMLKVIITECGGSPTEWEWRVCDAAGQPLRIGWQRSRNAAKQEGERALFRLIDSDSINPIPKNMPTRGH